MEPLTPTLWIAFGAGLVSFFTPCVLVLVPAFLANLAGLTVSELQSSQATQSRAAALRATLWFVTGFTVVFTALGALSGLFGRQVAVAQDTLNLVAGILIIAFGLMTMGVLKTRMLLTTFRLPAESSITQRGGLQSFLVGLVFAIGWSPCVGPVLAAILLLGSTTATIASSTVLLFVYSLGLMLPFLLFALFLPKTLQWIRTLRPHLHTIESIAGLLLIGLGLLVATGQLSRLIGTLYFLAPSSL